MHEILYSPRISSTTYSTNNNNFQSKTDMIKQKKFCTSNENLCSRTLSPSYKLVEAAEQIVGY